MKPIRLFAMPSHAAVERTSGVDFARVIQPMEHLSKLKDFNVTIYDPSLNKKMNWIEAIENNDIVFLNYTTNAWAFAIMGAIARKKGRIIISDMDDALWEVLPDNTAYEVFKQDEVQKTVSAICDEVDYITCTNPYLRNVIAHNTNSKHDKIKIMPNYINLNLYSHRCEFKDTHEIQLTHFGSTSHFKSLQDEEFNKGIDMIFKDYPNVILKTIGANIPKYKNRWGRRYMHGFGDVDVYKWIAEKFPGFMDETDIIVAPLSDNTYNRCKSSIKFIEASSAKKPGVWQRIRQYNEVVEEGYNGFLARTATEWYQSIKKLIEDKRLRKKVGEMAFKTVKDDWQMKDNVYKYADLFKESLDKQKKK